MLKTVLRCVKKNKYSIFFLFISFLFSDAFCEDSTVPSLRASTTDTNKSVTVIKPSSVIESDTLSSTDPANYDSLPDCPEPQKLNCKDINGVLANSGISEDCPPACKVEDNVTTTKIAGIEYVKTYTPGKCPLSYVIGATYKMGKEVLYDANPSPYPTPIPDFTTYNNYKNIPNTVCVPADPVRYKSHCQTGAPDYPTGTNTQVDGAYSYIVSDGRTNRCYDQYTCPGPSTLSCSLSTTKRYYNVQYKYMQCTPPAGYFFTGRDAPTRKICLRQHVKWSQNSQRFLNSE